MRDALSAALRRGGFPETCCARLAFSIASPLMRQYVPSIHRVQPPGSCTMICRVAPQFHGVLSPGLPLPLQWGEGPHSALLPPSLLKLADDVASVIDAGEGKAGSLGLQPAPQLQLTEETSLADDLMEEVGSAWGTLAAGWLSAAQGLYQSSDIWASVAWNGGLARVDGLAEKISAAPAWGVRRFFVHWSQWDDALKVCERLGDGTALAVEPLGRQQDRQPRQAIADLVSALSDEPAAPDWNRPDAEAQFEQCRYYHSLLRVPKTDDFYRTHLLDTLVDRLRERLLARYPDMENVQSTWFVTICSGNRNLAALSARAVNAKRTLLLHTKDIRGHGLADECAALIGRDRCDQHGFDEEHSVEQIPEIVRNRVADAPPSQVILDLKPGSKRMTYAMTLAAPKGSLLLNIETQFKDGAHVPGTENPELLSFPMTSET